MNSLISCLAARVSWSSVNVSCMGCTEVCLVIFHACDTATIELHASNMFYFSAIGLCIIISRHYITLRWSSRDLPGLQISMISVNVIVYMIWAGIQRSLNLFPPILTLYGGPFVKLIIKEYQSTD